jgi:hypothetical protein
MKTSATRALRVEIVAMCTVGIISTCVRCSSSELIVSLTLQPWRLKRHVPLTSLLIFAGLLGVISQNREFFVTNALRTSNPTYVISAVSLTLIYCAQIFCLFLGIIGLVIQRLVSFCKLRVYSLLLHSIYNNLKSSNIIIAKFIFDTFARPKRYPGYVTEQPIWFTHFSVYLGHR